MTKQARTARNAIKTASGAGGSASVAWGPSFGGVDGDQFSAGVALAMDAIALENDKSIGVAVVMDAIALENTTSIGINATMPELAMEHTKTVGVDVSQVEIATSGILAPKDVYCDTVALCPVDTNRDASNLLVSGTAAATADAYMAWDLSVFPPTATITAATLTLNVTVAPLASQTINVFKIANADETWDEVVMKCSDRKAADGAAMQSFAGGTVTGDISVTLNATVIARLQARLGVGYCTLLLQNAAANLLSTTFQRGDGNASGPRLALTMNLAV